MRAMTSSTANGDWQHTLLAHLSVHPLFGYMAEAFLLSVLIRFIVFVLRAIDAPTEKLPRPFWKPVLTSYVSLDHIHPFILGWIELTVYPVLMASGAWTVIGAWIGFKTVAQWERWKMERNIFNVFLIGNALVVILSYLLLTSQVTFKPIVGHA
jgi:hypothetical protein